MSTEDLNDEDVVIHKKQKMSFEKFIKQFNTIDTSNYGGWPLSVKVTVWIFVFMLVCALGYFVAVRGMTAKIELAHDQQKNLLNEFRDKDSKLRNLQQYEAQLKVIEANFSQQLEQLPKESEIPSLVEDINMTGVNSGLVLRNISLGGEIKQEFFVEQPINISATGDYHSFGSFVSAIAALPRIVTLHDFRIESKQVKLDDVPKISYTVAAKTYRYAGDSVETNAAIGAQP